MRIWAREAAREILVLVVHKPHPTQIELAKIIWEHYLQRGLDLDDVPGEADDKGVPPVA